MSRFYASIQGNHGEVTRQGTPNSGIGGHIRGWDVGVEVYVEVDADGNDRVSVFRTSGSNGRGRTHLIAEFTVATPDHEESV